MQILAIETSCDETAIALLEATGDLLAQAGESAPDFRVLASSIASQATLHAEYGGVFPMMAKREHIKNLPIVLDKVMINHDPKCIDVIAVTVGPGLEPALWTGITFTKELAEKWQKPIIPVNHMEGHILSALVPEQKVISKSEFLISKEIQDTKSGNFNLNPITFPAIALLVSGGHTELVLVKAIGEYEIIGETRDDAAGECFDKVARMLGLPYPGGPEISRLADEGRRSNANGQVSSISLPRPMIHSKDFDFSFSGLKTAVLYLLRDITKEHPNILENVSMLSEIAQETEDAIVDVLVAKTLHALEHNNVSTLLLGGGVSANQYLRAVLSEKCAEKGYTLHISPLSLTGDNATMIALAGYFRYLNEKAGTSPDIITANGTLRL